MSAAPTNGVSSPHASRWIWLALAMALLTVVSHGAFLLRDGRVAADMGLTWTRVPALFAALHGGPLPSMFEPGAWQELGVALTLAVVGPSSFAFQMVDMVWLAVLLAGVGFSAHALGGARAAAAAVAVAGTVPALVLQARMSWIHIPEAALVMGVWCASTRAEPLRSRLLMVLGALALSLRPSALVWLVPLVMVAFSAERAARWPLRVPVAWMVGALPSVLVLPGYITAKIDARSRYVDDVPAFLAQLPDQLGGFGGPLVLVGGMAVLPVLFRARDQPRVRVLVVWAVLPIALFLGSRAGLDNFTPAFAALAVLVGVGLSRHRVLVGAALMGWLVFTSAQHLPTPTGTLADVASAARLPMEPRLRNVWRSYDRWTGEDLTRLVQATCPAGACTIATDHGLLRPDGEEPGALERFLLRLERVDLVSLRTPDAELPSAMDALVHYDCPELEAAWRQRHPHSLARYRAAVTAHDLRVAWQRRLDAQCTVYWLTPGGTVSEPGALPASDPIPDTHPVQVPREGDRLESARRRPGRRQP